MGAPVRRSLTTPVSVAVALAVSVRRLTRSAVTVTRAIAYAPLDAVALTS